MHALQQLDTALPDIVGVRASSWRRREPQSRGESLEEVGVGGVHVLYPNRRRSLQRRGYRYLTQDSPGVKSDGAELLDGFGSRLAQTAP